MVKIHHLLLLYETSSIEHIIFGNTLFFCNFISFPTLLAMMIRNVASDAAQPYLYSSTSYFVFIFSINSHRFIVIADHQTKLLSFGTWTLAINSLHSVAMTAMLWPFALLKRRGLQLVVQKKMVVLCLWSSALAGMGCCVPGHLKLGIAYGWYGSILRLPRPYPVLAPRWRASQLLDLE